MGSFVRLLIFVTHMFIYMSLSMSNREQDFVLKYRAPVYKSGFISSMSRTSYHVPTLPFSMPITRLYSAPC
ncbi:hypothetical protein BJ166DRAFT_183265 [Pestalotiopsis sp. NC0098]|nr:hypothetical protein BJ166DRAFT_183265 [Pestalotiopsis sp. NC0098]